MNPRTFLQQFEQSKHRDALVAAVSEAMTDFCIEAEITTDEISEQEIGQLAEAFVTRGLNVPESQSTKIAKEKYRTGDNKIQALEDMDEMTDEELEVLKQAHEIGTSDVDFTVEE